MVRQKVHAVPHDEAAVNETEPPVIVAASANNQAVTNIIDSFGKIDEPEASLLAGRWLEGINSYGIYCPSQEKIREDKDKFQIADCSSKNRGPFPTKIEDPEYVKENAAYFITKCSQYAQKEFLNLSDCLKHLHTDLKNTVFKMSEGMDLFKKYSEYRDRISSLYGKYGGIEKYIELKELKAEKINNKIHELKAVEDGWLQHFSTEHWLLTLFAFLSPVKNRRMIRNRRYYNSTDFKIEADFSCQVEILKSIEDKKSRLSDRKKDHESALNKANGERDELKNLKESFLSWLNRNRVEWEKKREEESSSIKKTKVVDLYNLRFI